MRKSLIFLTPKQKLSSLVRSTVCKQFVSLCEYWLQAAYWTLQIFLLPTCRLWLSASVTWQHVRRRSAKLETLHWRKYLDMYCTVLINATVTVSTLYTLRPLKCLNDIFSYSIMLLQDSFEWVKWGLNCVHYVHGAERGEIRKRKSSVKV